MATAITDPAMIARLNSLVASQSAPAPAVAPAAAPAAGGTTVDTNGEGMAPEVTVHGNGDTPAPAGTPVTDPAMIERLNALMAAAPNATPSVNVEGSAASGIPSSTPSTGIPAPQPEQSVIPHFLDKFKQGVSGTIALAGVPTSLIGSAMELAGMPKGPTFGGFTSLKNGVDSVLGVKHIKAPTDLYGNVSQANEALGTIAEFLGGALIPGAGAVAAADQKIATAVVMALGTTESAMFSVKGKDLGGRLGESLGVGKERGEEIGAMLGSFLGPGLTNMAGQAVVKSLNKGLDSAGKLDIHGFSKEAQLAASNQMLKKEIVSSLELHPDSAANIADAIRMKQKIDKFSPNIAQMSGAPGLVSMYREVANKSPESLAKAAAADQINLTSIANFKDKSFPPTGRSLTDPAKVKLAMDQNAIELQQSAVEAKLSALTDKFRTRADNEVIGKELRELYWKARAAEKGRLDSKIGGVYETARKYGIREDMSDVREAVKKVTTADRNTFQDIPATYREVLTKYPAATPPSLQPVGKTGARILTGGSAGRDSASFEELHSLYKEANKDWALAIASGNAPAAAQMAMIRDMLKAKVDKYNGSQYGELATKFQDFNTSYSKYSSTFREGAGGEMAKRTKNGLTTDAEDIVNRVILQSGDKKKGVQDFFQIYGSDVRAAELLHDGLLDNFAAYAVKNGTLNPQAASAWLKNNQAALSLLPDLRKPLENTTAISKELIIRRKQLIAERSVLDKSTLAKVAGVEDQERLIQDAIRSPKLMEALLAGAHSQESKQSVARAIVDSVVKQADPYGFLVKNEASLKPVMESLGKGHWDNLMTLGEAGKITARTNAPTSVELGKIKDIGEKLVGTSFKGLSQRALAAAQGRVSQLYTAIDVSGRFIYKIRSEDLARLREQAMFDTDTADLLAKLSSRKEFSKVDLLNLQHMGFASGVNSTLQAMQAPERLKDERKQLPQQEWGPGTRGRTGGLAEKGKGRTGWGH